MRGLLASPGGRFRELLQQALLQRQKVGGQRHAGGAQLVQLLVNLQIEFVQVLGLIIHLAQKKADLRLQFFECHLITSSGNSCRHQHSPSLAQLPV